jgi:glycerol 3-phosphatase-2
VAGARTLGAAYAAFVCDLDGVVYRGPVAIEHAVGALTAAGRPIQYATNNASRPPAEVAAHLRELGLAVEPDDVATSSQAGAAAIRHALGEGAAVLAVGGAGVALALTEAGLRAVRPGESDDVAGVLQGYGPGVTAAMLGEAAYAVQRGAYWVATNLDLTLPTDRGTAPGNGALVSAVTTACGRGPDDVVGKPYSALYVLCADRLAQPREAILAIGDRLDTDIEGAVAARLDSLLVLTGVSTVGQAAAAPADSRPTYLAPDLRSLDEELPRPARDGASWVCGGDRGRIVDARWVSEATGTAGQGLTNRLHAAYAAQDAGVLGAQEAARIVAGPGRGD